MMEREISQRRRLQIITDLAHPTPIRANTRHLKQYLSDDGLFGFDLLFLQIFAVMRSTVLLCSVN